VGRAGEPPVEVVVTTYTYFERESSGDDRKFLRAQDWSYLVLDEAHGVSHKALSPRG
jgi:SNF2 family DNA or RNA helicase